MLTKNIFKWGREHNYPRSGEEAAICSVSDLHFNIMSHLQYSQSQRKTTRDSEGTMGKRRFARIKVDYHTEPYIDFNLQRGQRSLHAQ